MLIAIVYFFNVIVKLLQECVGVLSGDKIFMIISQYRIYPNEKFFAPIMDTLQLRQDGNINYRGLLDLLNWRRAMPVLPKMQRK